MKEFADDFGLVLACGAVLSLKPAPGKRGDLSSEVFEVKRHVSNYIPSMLLKFSEDVGPKYRPRYPSFSFNSFCQRMTGLSEVD